MLLSLNTPVAVPVCVGLESLSVYTVGDYMRPWLGRPKLWEGSEERAVSG